MAEQVYVVVGVYSGVTNEIRVCRTEKRALAHYDRLREEYGIHTDEEAESEHDCQMWPVKIEE
jgi:hypothetical protein